MKELFISDFPFDIGYYQKRDPRLPRTVPFTLGYDERLGLIVGKMDSGARAAMNLYYSLGGYGSTPVGEGSFGQRRGSFMLDAVKRCLNRTGKTFSQLSFLEIGSSYGYLLYLIKNEGAKEVLGVEPGEEGIVGSKKYGVPLIQDFFPTKLLTKKYDFILSHCVLEHIENPLLILEEVYTNLNEDGTVFIAVPDCEKKLSLGDVSAVSHQHVNYFTPNSLRRSLEAAGFKDIVVETSNQMSILFGWGKKDQSGQATMDKRQGRPEGDGTILQIFIDNYAKNLATLQTLIDQLETEHQTIGLYGDCGVLKGLLKFKVEPRMFDSDQAKHGKYMCSATRSFESPRQLIKNPVDVLFITPIDYDREIRENLKSLGLDEKLTKLISVKEIYEQNSGSKYPVGRRSSRR